jgi:hypothetical protein
MKKASLHLACLGFSITSAYTGVELHGSWNSTTGNYTSMLTRGDNGCASIIHFVTGGIAGENTIFNVDESDDSTQEIASPPDIFAPYYAMISGQTTSAGVSNLSIYPNPTASKITSELLNNTPIRNLFLIDLLGRVVRNDNVENQITWNVSDLPSGIYLLRACDSNGVTQEFRSISIQ